MIYTYTGKSVGRICQLDLTQSTMDSHNVRYSLIGEITGIIVHHVTRLLDYSCRLRQMHELSKASALCTHDIT